MAAKVAWEGVENVSHETGKKFFIIEEKMWYKILHKLEEHKLLKKKIYHGFSEKLQDNLTQLLFGK
ncbi:MAG: hypothetical protein NZM25_07465 [Leptospiraceae bacterium]|nr:hypothetical protein [Leptospiraceae bacterium]